MAQTPTQAFPYPVPGDQPDVPTDIRGLAEALDTKITALDAAVTSLQTRATALEDGTGGIGWIPIQTGNSSGSSFTIDLTDGGRFTDPPLWNMIQIHMRIDLSAAGDVNCRINGDTDAVYRSGSNMIDAQNTFDPEQWHFPAATSWVVGHLSTISTGNLIFTLFHTGANPGLLNFQATSARQSDDVNVHRFTTASGSLTTAKTASSLEFLPRTGGDTFVNVWWWATGLRMVAP